jgi:hypothetical protein
VTAAGTASAAGIRAAVDVAGEMTAALANMLEAAVAGRLVLAPAAHAAPAGQREGGGDPI